MLNGIAYILRTGAPWRDLPKRYGPLITVYNRYVRWGEHGIWKGILDALSEHVEDNLIFIDASIAKPHRAAVGSKRRRWRKVLAAHAQIAQAKFTWP